MSWAKLFWTLIGLVGKSAVESGVEHSPGFFKRVANWWKGKTIAVVGPTASGKNSMFNRLQKAPIPKHHVQTRGAEKVKNFPISWPLPDGTHVKFTCKRSINVGGEIDERERYWLQSCEGADVIFYLVDAEKLLAERDATIERYKEDLDWLLANFRHLKEGVDVHILLNKIDLILGRKPYSDSAQAKCEELVKILEEGAKSELKTYFKRVKGVSPISMSNASLFSRYFTGALESLSSLRN